MAVRSVAIFPHVRIFSEIQLQGVVVWDFWDECGATRVEIHLATVMAEAVADYQIGNAQHIIVGGYLVEHFLGDVDGGRLVFHDHDGLPLLGIQDTVTSAGGPVEAYRHLVPHERGGISLVPYEVVDEVLAHPFLGGEGYKTVSQYVENVGTAVGGGYICLEGGEI